jgi:hypothetical protein
MQRNTADVFAAFIAPEPQAVLRVKFASRRVYCRGRLPRNVCAAISLNPRLLGHRQPKGEQ